MCIGEASLLSVLSMQKHAVGLSDDNAPEHLESPVAILDAQIMAEPLKLLNAALDKFNKAESSNSTLDASILKRQATVLLAYAEMCVGNNDKAFELLQNVSFPTKNPENCGQAYPVYVVMHGVLLGWSSYLSGNILKAIGFFLNASKLVSQFIPGFNCGSNTNQLTHWVEEELFGTAMFLIRVKKRKDAVPFLTDYLSLVSNFPPDHHSLKRIAVLRHKIRDILDRLPDPSVFSEIPNFDCVIRHIDPSSFPSDDLVAATKELKSLLPQYEKLLTILAPFPRGSDVTAISDSRYKKVLELFGWWVQAEIVCGRLAKETTKEVVQRHYRLLETLYRGTKHTFQSLRLLRFISHTFVSLLLTSADNMNRDERTEAECAVATYLFYWEKKSSMLIDSERKKHSDNRDSIYGQQEPHPTSSPESPTVVTSGKGIPDSAQQIGVSSLVITDKVNGSESSPLEGATVISRTPPVVSPILTTGAPGLGRFVQDPSYMADIDLNATSKDATYPISPTASSPTSFIEIMRKQSVRDDRVDSRPDFNIANKAVYGVSGDSARGTHVLVQFVDGDTPLDAIGVLISGMRILLSNHCGNLQKLLLAAEYGEKAYLLATEHLSHLPNYSIVLKKIYRWLGVVYGEQALEVTNSALRVQLQVNATAMFEKAISVDPDNYLLYYQLGLQLAESGEFLPAMDSLDQSISLNPGFPNAYNLLALLLSSKSQYTKALEIIDEGWRTCVAAFAKDYHSDLPKFNGRASFGAPSSARSSPEPPSISSHQRSGIVWDLVPINLREDMINLKLTQVALEIAQFGPLVAIETLLGLFALARKLLGALPKYEDVIEPKAKDDSLKMGARVSVNDFDKLRKNSQMSLKGKDSTISLRVSAFPSSGHYSETQPKNSSLHNSISLPVITSKLHRHRVFELYIVLWITTSSIYRELGQFDDAKQAVAEAEKILEMTAAIESSILELQTHAFRRSLGLSPWRFDGSNSALSTLAAKAGGPIPPSSTLNMISTGTRQWNAVPPGTEYLLSCLRWGSASSAIRRLAADVSFEQMLTQFTVYKAQTNHFSQQTSNGLASDSSSAHKYNKYLSPVAKVESERRSKLRQKTALHSSNSCSSILSMSTNNNVRNTLEMLNDDDKSLAVISDSPNLLHPISSMRSSYVPPPDNSDTNFGNFSPTEGPKTSVAAIQRSVTGRIAVPPASLPQISSIVNQRVDLDQLIDATEYITIIDGDHLPARVHLGLLHLEKGNLDIAEHNFVLACTQCKARGSGSGISGITTAYGGLTSIWSTIAWQQYASILIQTGRVGQARASILFAIDLDKMRCSRGYECLPRYLTNFDSHVVPSSYQRG